MDAVQGSMERDVIYSISTSFVGYLIVAATTYHVFVMKLYCMGWWSSYQEKFPLYVAASEKSKG